MTQTRLLYQNNGAVVVIRTHVSKRGKTYKRRRVQKVER